MKENREKYFAALDTAKNSVLIMIIVAAFLAVLHFYFADLKSGGVYWFNLDKERNFPTWFSGMLFFLLGCSAVVAFYWENKQNESHSTLFRLPVLWLAVALIGFGMSLDEMTILHENLFWKEVRTATSELGDTMKYVTQWQVLFAPAILLILTYFGMFFINRYSASSKAIYNAFSGIALWILAVLLEGTRQTFINAGADMYKLEIILEETFEMMGAILLIYSVVTYTIEISLDLNKKRIAKLSNVVKLLTRKGTLAMGIIIIVLILSGGIIYHFAKIQSSQDAPVPTLYKKAVED